MLLKSLMLLTCLIATGSTFQMSKTDKIRHEILQEFDDQMAERNIYIAGWGGGAKENKINLIKAAMDIDEIMSIESARKLILDSTDSLMRIINSNARFKENYINYPYPLKNISLSILGRTPEPYKKFIKVVFLLDGHLYYCTDDPEKDVAPFIDVYDETYDEAKAIVHEQHPD